MFFWCTLNLELGILMYSKIFQPFRWFNKSKYKEIRHHLLNLRNKAYSDSILAIHILNIQSTMLNTTVNVYSYGQLKITWRQEWLLLPTRWSYLLKPQEVPVDRHVNKPTQCSTKNRWPGYRGSKCYLYIIIILSLSQKTNPKMVKTVLVKNGMISNPYKWNIYSLNMLE